MIYLRMMKLQKISDRTLSTSVIGAFAWIASKDVNPRGVTFYLKYIYFEK